MGVDVRLRYFEFRVWRLGVCCWDAAAGIGFKV